MVGRKPLGGWDSVGVSVGVSGLGKLAVVGVPVLVCGGTGELARVLPALAVGVASGVVLRCRIAGRVVDGGGS
jgi:hypothetical protein